MFTRILVPLDGTPEAEAVLAYATTMARTCDAPVTCLDVVDLMSGMGRLRPIDPLTLQLRRAEVEAYLHRVAANLRDAGLVADAALAEGPAADAIVHYCQRHGIDLVIMCHHGHGRCAMLSAHAYSVSMAVAHSACASVMLINARQAVTTDVAETGFRRILVPVDGSQRAECVLPIVDRLAARSGGDVLLVHVVQSPEVPRRMPLSSRDTDLVRELMDRNRAESEHYVEGLLKRLPARARGRVLMGGHTAAQLHAVADQENADLIVLSAHGYSAQTQWPYGGVTSSFIDHGDRPLLVVQDAPVGLDAILAERAVTRPPVGIAPADQSGGE